MNQIIKDVVYGKGNRQQVGFIAHIGGMNEEEASVFQLIHEGKTELFIQNELNLSCKAYKRIEESVRAKMLLAIFDCINYRMDHE